MRVSRFQPWRRGVRLLEAALILGLPFLIIEGESALRFDIPSLRLHFFGVSLWMDEFFILLVGTLFLIFLFVLITLLFGRVWCGWLCPQTVLGDMTRSVEKARGKGLIHSIGPWVSTLIVSSLAAANLIWYFVSPYDFISQLWQGSMGRITGGFWIIMTAILFLNFVLLRQRFCATVCPYAKLQGVLFDDKTQIIAMDPRRKEECIECLACVRVCPVNIDIREGLSSACINCAECIDRCAAVMAGRQKSSLIGYFFGVSGDGRELLRKNVLMIGFITLLFLCFFVYVLLSRSPLDLIVLPNYSFSPRIARDGSLVNSYILSVRNRGRSDMDLKIFVEITGGRVNIAPSPALQVKAGALKKVPVYLSVKKQEGQAFPDRIAITVGSAEGESPRVTREARFLLPER